MRGPAHRFTPTPGSALGLLLSMVLSSAQVVWCCNASGSGQASCRARRLPSRAAARVEKGDGSEKGTQLFSQPFNCLRGRPRERSVHANPKRLPVRFCQWSAPKGQPRWMERRTASSSASVGARLTCLSQCFGSGSGQRCSSCLASRSPCTRRHRLDHRQSSARFTRPARSAFRSA